MKKIQITDWTLKDIFIDTVRQKGYLLFYENRVELLHQKGKRYDFVVKGTKDHQAHVELEQHNMHLTCDCSALKKGPCHHLAACLYYIKEYLPPKEMKLTRKEERILLDYQEDLDEWLQEDRNTVPFAEILEEWLREIHEDYLESRWKEGLDKLFLLYVYCDSLDQNQIGMNILAVLDRINERLKDFLIPSYEAVEKKFRWYQELDLDITMGDIVSMLSVQASSYLEAEYIMKLVDLALKDPSSKEENLYYAKVKLLQEFLDEEEAERLIQKQLLANPGIKDYYIRLLLSKGDLDTTEALLKKDLEQGNIKLEHADLLGDIYQAQGSENEHCRVLLYCYASQPTLERYLMLKEALSKAAYRTLQEELYVQAYDKNKDEYLKILKFENEHRLIFAFYVDKGMRYIDSIQDQLLDEYPKELRDVYSDVLLNTLDDHTYTFDETLYYFYRLASLPDGMKRAKRVLSAWKKDKSNYAQKVVSYFQEHPFR